MEALYGCRRHCEGVRIVEIYPEWYYPFYSLSSQTIKWQGVLPTKSSHKGKSTLILFSEDLCFSFIIPQFIQMQSVGAGGGMQFHQGMVGK